MRLYEFKNSDKNIDVVVATDGSGEQKKVFITETPRGIPIPGNTSAIDNPNSAILEMGFDFVAGTEREHLDFLLFALNNGLQLIQWNEGLGEISPIELLPEKMEFGDYKVEADPTELSFTAAGGSDSFTVKSTKTVTSEGFVKGMIVDVKYKVEITGDGFSLNDTEDMVIASANTGAGRSGTVTITQLEGDSPATASITLSQTAGA
jgi:hypothetical protein